MESTKPRVTVNEALGPIPFEASRQQEPLLSSSQSTRGVTVQYPVESRYNNSDEENIRWMDNVDQRGYLPRIITPRSKFDQHSGKLISSPRPLRVSSDGVNHSLAARTRPTAHINFDEAAFDRYFRNFQRIQRCKHVLYGRVWGIPTTRYISARVDGRSWPRNTRTAGVASTQAPRVGTRKGGTATGTCGTKRLSGTISTRHLCGNKRNQRDAGALESGGCRDAVLEGGRGVEGRSPRKGPARHDDPLELEVDQTPPSVHLSEDEVDASIDSSAASVSNTITPNSPSSRTATGGILERCLEDANTPRGHYSPANRDGDVEHHVADKAGVARAISPHPGGRSRSRPAKRSSTTRSKRRSTSAKDDAADKELEIRQRRASSMRETKEERERRLSTKQWHSSLEGLLAELVHRAPPTPVRVERQDPTEDNEVRKDRPKHGMEGW
ncbi:hypothetical protein FOZ60_002433 [Perkinsus olseni]|uniref:Uncharacterized protein n=1 Tax=Perkinsus olseni TaxID=32597 RepID=A0A7J6NYV1_PEROL|nr:hypothetical protein FOZ60_002433 [Perkinsus olseni]